MEYADLWAKQDTFVRKFEIFSNERMVIITAQTGEGLIVDPERIFKLSQSVTIGDCLQKEGKKEKNIKNLKKFLSNCRHFESQTRVVQLRTLRCLMERNNPLSVFGFTYNGITIHHIKNPVRTRHIFGLSDAVDLACSNMNISPRFPSFKRKNLSNLQQSETIVATSLRFKKGQMYFSKKCATSHSRRFYLILHYLRNFPKGLAEKEYVKLIKLSLAGTFSLEMDQELPEGFRNKSIALFPPLAQRKLDNVLKRRGQKKLRTQFYFNLLQSKSVCAPVGEDMIKEQYEKHQASLCRPESEVLNVPTDMLDELFEYGQKVGRRVNELYDPFSTKLPNGRSCVERSREDGGNYQGLEMNGTIKRFSGHPILNMMVDKQHTRLEPFVIGLFGRPGCGKTTTVNHLLNKLRRIINPNAKREDFVYSRSCATKHWDGYNGQPVVVLDDFGQDLANRNDLAEFMTLVSLNDYQLPMAELKDKGILFRSPIIILTSNMQYGSIPRDGSGASIIEDPIALWRRFDFPLLLRKEGKEIKFHRFQPISAFTENKRHFYDKRELTESHHWTACQKFSGNCPEEKIQYEEDLIKDDYFRHGMRVLTATRRVKTYTFYQFFQDVEIELQKKWDFHQHTFFDSWTQEVYSHSLNLHRLEGPFWDLQINEDRLKLGKNSHTCTLDFPLKPPNHPPQVKAIALPEPLKVRMITAAECDTKVLQPFQIALWKYLSEQPQFCLTNGVKDLEDFEGETLPWIYRIEKVVQNILEHSENKGSDEEELWLSGDYTAATDNFPMQVTHALIEGILSQIEHEPTKEWVRWEVSPHEISYPGGQRGTQTSGQLMGSLLSFPLLCFLNDYAVSSSGFEVGSYLINGDDVVARGIKKKILDWQGRAPQVGLSLSVGKNFIDSNFCTINSQLFFNGELRNSGKVSCQTRHGTTLSYCFAESQFYWGAEERTTEIFLKRNVNELRKCARSLAFSRHHGGLGLLDTFQPGRGIRTDMGRNKYIYLYDLLKKFDQITMVPNSPVAIVATPVFQVEGNCVLRGQGTNDQIFHKITQMSEARKEDPQFEDLSLKKLEQFKMILPKRLSQNVMDQVRGVIRSPDWDLRMAPPSNFLTTRYLCVSRTQADRLRNLSLEVATKLILQEWKNPLNPSPFGEDIGIEDIAIEDLNEISNFYTSFDGSGKFLFYKPEEGERVPTALELYGDLDDLEDKGFEPRPQFPDTLNISNFFGVSQDNIEIIEMDQCCSK